MTIYILGTPEETAQALDDRSLDKMIKSVAQVLCDAHYFLSEGDYKKNYSTPLPLSETVLVWAQWARECKANYLYLVELLDVCLLESGYRNYKGEFSSIKHLARWNTYDDIKTWARESIPDLPICSYLRGSHRECSHFPIIVPNKYIVDLPWICDGCYEYEETIPHDCDVAEEIRVVESYRNYYQAKLLQRASKRKCSNCNNTCDDNNCYTCGMQRIAYSDIDNKCVGYYWTNRQKPEWINLWN